MTKNDEKIRLNEFVFPKSSGSFKGKLKYRKFASGKPCLMCYFQTETGAKLILPVWENEKTKRYTPKDNGFCFRNDVTNGSDWYCEYEVTSSHKAQFVKASLLTSKNNETIYAVKFFLMLIKRAFPRQLIANIAVSKFSLSEKVIFIGTDCQIEYKIEIEGGDYAVTRRKKEDSKEKSTCILIDGKSFDSISKTYE